MSQVLVPGDADAERSALCGYTITTRTSDARGAGTDGCVTLALVGKDEGGNRVAMGPFPLETSADDFKRGATDTFRAEGPFMVEIVSATVAHDGAGFFGGSDWRLESLEVTKRASGGCGAQNHVLVRRGHKEGRARDLVRERRRRAASRERPQAVQGDDAHLGEPGSWHGRQRLR